MDRRTFLAAAAAATAMPAAALSERAPVVPLIGFEFTPTQLRVLRCKLPRMTVLGGCRSGKNLTARQRCLIEVNEGKRVAAVSRDSMSVERDLARTLGEFPEIRLMASTTLPKAGTEGGYDFIWINEAIVRPEETIGRLEEMLAPGGRILWTSFPSGIEEQKRALLRWPVVANLPMINGTYAIYRDECARYWTEEETISRVYGRFAD